MSTQISSLSLPYIEIDTTKGKLKLLIDSGSNVNLISKRWGYSAPYSIDSNNSEPKYGVTGKITLQESLKIPLFRPHFDKHIEFFIFGFHPYFDGILGTDVILDGRCKLDFAGQTMTLEGKYTIPIRFYTPVASRRGECSNLAETTHSRLRTEHLTDQERALLEQTLDGLDEVFRDPDRSTSLSLI